MMERKLSSNNIGGKSIPSLNSKSTGPNIGWRRENEIEWKSIWEYKAEKNFKRVVAPLLNVRRGQGIIGVIKMHWGASSVSKGASHHTWQPTER